MCPAQNSITAVASMGRVDQGVGMKEPLLERVLRSQRLPSLPAVALEVIDLVQRPDVNLNDIAEVIQNDPALSSKILKTVNSSFYGQSKAVSSISHALVVLGLNSVKTLALGFTLVTNLKQVGDDGFDHVHFWTRSIFSATATKALAKQINLVQQEEAFLGGLLQDIGMLALYEVVGQPYGEILKAAADDNNSLVAIEQKTFQVDHTQIGAALAESWRLPPLLVAPIRFHESPDQADAPLLPLVRCVVLGNHAADVFICHEASGEALESYLSLAKQWFGLQRNIVEPLLKDIHRQTAEMRRLLDLPTGELGNPDAILTRANEALMHITLQTEHQTTQLRRENELLNEQINIDSLTDVANRRRFNEYIVEQFNLACDQQTPLSLLFFDTDHFKSFNDTYGHQTGDRVLVEFAAVLKRAAADKGLTARYGGEEFAIILPGMDRRTAAMLAEQVRQEVMQASVESDEGEQLHFAASVGAATFVDNCFSCPDQLIKAADQAVYAAKAAGRNCVRVFVPKLRRTPAA